MERGKRILTEKWAAGVFRKLAAVLFCLLLYRCVGMTWENSGLTDEHVYANPDSLLWNVLATGAVLAGLALLRRVPGRALKKCRGTWPFEGAVCLAAVLMAGGWVHSVNAMPMSDQATLCAIATALNRGDYSAFGYLGYLSAFPQQLGLVTVLRVVFALFGEGNYRMFQYLMAPCVGLVIFCGFQIVKKLAPGDRTVHGLYGLLMLTCAPLYFFTSFVYGEVSSTAFALLAVWLLMDCLDCFHPGKAAVMGLAMGVAIQLRENVLILLVAAVIVLIFRLTGPQRRQALAAGAALLLGAALPALVLKACYAPHIPDDASEPIPAILWVAMGTNDEEDGWCNSLNTQLYYQNGGDMEVCHEVGRRVVAEFADHCRNDVSFARDFFYRKMNSQWNVPMYQSLAMSSTLAGPQGPFARAIYEGGDLRIWLEGWANLYQILVYGGTLLVLLFLGRDWPLGNFLLLIAVFGGYLFTIFWEAKTRYVFPYFVFLLPYAAVGCGLAVRWIDKKLGLLQNSFFATV